MHKQERSKLGGHGRHAGRAHKRASHRHADRRLEPPEVVRFVREGRPLQLEEADWVLDEATTWPVDEEAHPRASAPRSGTLSSDLDGERLPVVDPGISIDPEDLGRQFLRDATEQDNYESLAETIEIDPGASLLEPLVSEASLEASAQAGFALPESAALNGSSRRERAQEPRSGVVDLMSNVVRESSLFDQPNERGDLKTPAVFADDQHGHIGHQLDEEDEERAGGPPPPRSRRR